MDVLQNYAQHSLAITRSNSTYLVTTMAYALETGQTYKYNVISGCVSAK